MTSARRGKTWPFPPTAGRPESFGFVLPEDVSVTSTFFALVPGSVDVVAALGNKAALRKGHAKRPAVPATTKRPNATVGPSHQGAPRRAAIAVGRAGDRRDRRRRWRFGTAGAGRRLDPRGLGGRFRLKDSAAVFTADRFGRPVRRNAQRPLATRARRLHYSCHVFRPPHGLQMALDVRRLSRKLSYHKDEGKGVRIPRQVFPPEALLYPTGDRGCNIKPSIAARRRGLCR